MKVRVGQFCIFCCHCHCCFFVFSQISVFLLSLIRLECDQPPCAFTATGKAYYTGFDTVTTDDEILVEFLKWLKTIYPGIQYLEVGRTVPIEISGANDSMATIEQNHAKYYLLTAFFSIFFVI